MANKIEVEIYKTDIVSVENGLKIEEALRLFEANNAEYIDDFYIKEVIDKMNIINIDFGVMPVDTCNEYVEIFNVVNKNFNTIMVVYYLKDL